MDECNFLLMGRAKLFENTRYTSVENSYNSVENSYNSVDYQGCAQALQNVLVTMFSMQDVQNRMIIIIIFFQLPIRTGLHTTQSIENVDQNKNCFISVSKHKFALVINGLTKTLQAVDTMVSFFIIICIINPLTLSLLSLSSLILLSHSLSLSLYLKLRGIFLLI